MSIEEKIIEASKDYRYVGIRIDDAEYYQIGDSMRNSMEFEARCLEEAIANGEELFEMGGTYVFELAKDEEFAHGLNVENLIEWIDENKKYFTVYLVGADKAASDFVATDIAKFGTVENLLINATVIENL